MGFEYHIDIIGKVKHNKNVVWYFDKNGIRYTDADIRRILGCLNEPMNVRLKALNTLVSTKLLQSGIDKISINMKVRGDKLISSKGVLDSLELSPYQIYVLCEDSKSGFTFYKHIFEFMYPNINFCFVTSSGNSTLNIAFSKILELNQNKVSRIIVMTDNKFESPAYRMAIANIKKMTLNNIDRVITYIFSPICVEEVLISNVNLTWKSYSALGDMIRNYLSTGDIYYKLEIDGNKYVNAYRLKNGERVENLEAYMANELPRVSSLRYSKKCLGPCYVSRCCPKVLNNAELRCNRANRKITGCASFCGNLSLAGAIQNIVNEMLGLKANNLKHWSKESRNNLYRRL